MKTKHHSRHIKVCRARAADDQIARAIAVQIRVRERLRDVLLVDVRADFNIRGRRKKIDHPGSSRAIVKNRKHASRVVGTVVKIFGKIRRTRNDDRSQPPGAPKMVFLKPLRAGWKERLWA